MICLVLDKSIANRHATNTIIPMLNTILASGNVSMSTPCLLITYNVGKVTVYSRSTLSDCVQKIKTLKYGNMSPMLNPLLDALYLAHTSLKSVESNRHIFILSSSLYMDGFVKPIEDINSMDDLVKAIQADNTTLSVICKKGLKPIEELAKTHWKCINPLFSVLIDPQFIPEIPHLTQQQQQQQIPPSVTFGQQQQPMPQQQQPQMMQQPMNHMIPQDFYPASEHLSPEVQAFQQQPQQPQNPPQQQQGSNPPLSNTVLWSGQLQMNEIVAPVAATPISKHDIQQLYFLFI